MPFDITPETPRKPRTIAGVMVQVPQLITAETPMTPVLASILNQTFAENFSNNLRDKIAKFVPEGAAEGTAPRVATADEAQALVDSYAKTYEPGVRTGGGGGRATLTPLEREVRTLAQDALNKLLGESSIKRSQLPKDGEGSYNQLLDQIVSDHGDALRARAEKIIAARERANKDGLDLGAMKLPGAPAAGGEGGGSGGGEG